MGRLLYSRPPAPDSGVTCPFLSSARFRSGSRSRSRGLRKRTREVEDSRVKPDLDRAATTGRTCLVAMLLVLSVALSVAPAATAQTEAELVSGLEWVQARMAEGRWPSAKTRLVQLLDEHRGADYARARRIEVSEHMQRCQFHLKHRPPRAGDLISGELVRQSRRTGSLTLRYTPETLDDFTPPIGAMRGRFHPMVLTGPYAIDIRGSDYPAEPGGVQVFVNENEGSVIAVICGGAAAATTRTSPMGIYRLLANGEQEDLTEPAPSPAVAGRRYAVSVQVGNTSIRVLLDGKVLMQAGKPGGEFGRFGFVDRSFVELVAEGPTGSGWLEGKVDAKRQEQKVRFERMYEPRVDLPEWLFEPPGATAAPSEARRHYPGAIRAEHVPALDRAAGLIADHELVEARQYLQGLSRRQMSRAARAYLMALCEIGLGNAEAALAWCNESCREDADFSDSHMLRARALARLRKTDAAIAELRALLERDPAYGHAYTKLTLLLLESGQLDHAKSVVLAGRTSGAEVPEINALDRMLTMALHGPDWHRTWEHTTTNYHVSSDVNRRVCIDAARLLEQAYSVYQAHLGRAPRTTQPFRVFLFSGEAGYQKYCAQTLGSTQPHTMGLYSPALKQLLIWNVPDREQMLETVRHEGFHQYLDRVMSDPPPWLNEGLAMYYEAVPPGEERPLGGLVRNDLLAALAPDRLPPLAEFTAQDAERFYADAEQNYPLSWALTHFSRQTTPARRLLFRRWFDALRDGQSNAEALRTALGTTSITELERDFRAHVELLRSRMPSARAPR